MYFEIKNLIDYISCNVFSYQKSNGKENHEKQKYTLNI